jgi:hypothetical protein
VYDSHDEVYYVLRQADGKPLAAPAWMTRPEAAYAGIVPAARVPVRVQFELQRVTATCLSSSVHNVHEEDHDAQPRARYQQELFEEPPAVPAVRLPLDVQEQLRQALAPWMQALAKMIHEEDDDEPDHR